MRGEILPGSRLASFLSGGQSNGSTFEWRGCFESHAATGPSCDHSIETTLEDISSDKSFVADRALLSSIHANHNPETEMECGDRSWLRNDQTTLTIERLRKQPCSNAPCATSSFQRNQYRKIEASPPPPFSSLFMDRGCPPPPFAESVGTYQRLVTDRSFPRVPISSRCVTEPPSEKGMVGTSISVIPIGSTMS